MILLPLTSWVTGCASVNIISPPDSVRFPIPTLTNGMNLMPTIRSVDVIAAGVPTFPLQGNQYEYLPFNARVEFAITEITPVALVGDVEATVFSGTDILQQQALISGDIAGKVTYPDDFLLDDVAAAGERLSVELRSAAGSATVETVVKITPL